MPENFEYNFEDEVIENRERAMKEIEGVIATPKDEFVRSSVDGGMRIFNNFMYRLPGHPSFEEDLRSKGRKTLKETCDKEEAEAMAIEFPKTIDMTKKQFAKSIIDALIETIVDVKEVAALNKRVEESKGKLLASKDNDRAQATEARRRALAELYYYVAPAAVSLLKKGFTTSELFS